MVTYSDIEYKLTKLIKQRKATIHEDFRSLKDWIDKTYNVHTMNIIYDTIDNPQKTPRLQVIFEFKEDRDKFNAKNNSNFSFDPEKQKAIANQFKEIFQQEKKTEKQGLLNFFKRSRLKYNTDNLFIVYSAFEPIAKQEAYSHIPSQQIKELKEKMDNKDVWTVITSFSSFVIFFYAERQVSENMTSQLRKELTQLCFELVKRYDEFGYLNKETYSVSLDSKENFDNNYESNWYYYFK